MTNQNTPLDAARIRAHEATNYNQRMTEAMAEGLRNVAREPNWKALTHEACELLTAQGAEIAKWRKRAFIGFGYFLGSVALLIWRMFQ